MLSICNSVEAPRSSGMDNGLYGSLQYPNKPDIIPHSTDYVPPIVNFEKRYNIFIPTRTDWDNLPHQFENAVNIYTDGSKFNSQAGGGSSLPT